MNDNWIENELDAPPVCVACGLPFESWQRRTESDAEAGPLHGACNPDADRRERERLWPTVNQCLTPDSAGAANPADRAGVDERHPATPTTIRSGRCDDGREPLVSATEGHTNA